MNADWYPGIQAFCSHWQHAPMLQQTLDTLEREFADDSDATIDAAKALVECACRLLVMDRLKRGVDRLNPDIPSEARQDALKKIIADETPSLIEENRRIHRALVEGIDVEFYVEDGGIG